MKRLAIVLVALLLLPSVSAYQQSHLVFDLEKSWNVVEQRHAAQTFEKQGMLLEVRSFTSRVQLLSPGDFAAARGGEVVSEAEYGKLKVKEAVVTDAELVYILSQLSQGDEVYTLALVAPKGLSGQARLEMQKLYQSLQISEAQRFADAPYEVPLEYPGDVTLPIRDRIPLGKLVLAGVVILIMAVILKRRRGKKG
ncbi:MAG: hypothetical protein HY555_05875 [Euryarchaeota archaeon]|nr:hypothetical protein [Euryarchaeota archaeon]